MINCAELIKSAPLRIVSGEGEEGSIQVYTGARTERAIKMRLKREARGGRWARLEAQVDMVYGKDWEPLFLA